MKTYSLAILCAALLLCGCSKGDGKVGVTGTVNWNGAPLKQGTITFLAPGQSSESAPVVDGEFAIRTLPGDKKVGITAIQKIEQGTDQERGTKTVIDHQFLPASYNTKSDLKAAISAESEPLVFDLTGEEVPPPAKVDPKNRPAVVERTR